MLEEKESVLDDFGCVEEGAPLPSVATTSCCSFAVRAFTLSTNSRSFFRCRLERETHRITSTIIATKPVTAAAAAAITVLGTCCAIASFLSVVCAFFSFFLFCLLEEEALKTLPKQASEVVDN